MRNIIIKIMLILTAVLLLIVLVFSLFDSKKPNDDESSLSPVEIMYNMRYIGSAGCDLSDYFENLMKDDDYYGFSLKNDYSMFFQVRDENQKSDLEKKLCLDSSLPDIDFSEKYLLVSVGKKPSLIGISTSYNEKEEIYPEVVYSESVYTEKKAFVYSMNKIDFVSGEEFEKYLFIKESSESNMIEVDITEGRTPIEEGKHYKLYDIDGNMYFAVFFNDSGETVKRPVFKGERPLFAEYSDNMIHVIKKDINYYYDVAKEVKSEDYTFPTEYLINDIITYTRNHNGELQFILRDAYDQYKYAKIVRVDFSYDVEDITTLVKHFEYVDDYHIKMTYIASGNVEKTEIVEVYYMGER